MIASRADRPPRGRSRAGPALVALALGLAPAPALAQTPMPLGPAPVPLSPPTTLAPPADAAAPEAAPEAPPAAAESEPLPPLPEAPSGTGVAVEVDTISTVDPDSGGVLGDEDGGLGTDMWRGTGRPMVARLLPALPVNAASPTMRDLMRRLLLTSARAPAGEGERGTLIALRARLLIDMGDLDGVNALIDAVPGRAASPRLARVEADARFLANDNARACALAAGEIRERDSVYWQKAFIFCQALAGEHDQAALGVSLLRELGVDDPAFFALVESLASGGEASIERLSEPEPLHLAMARAARTRLPADVIASNTPGVLRTIATNPGVEVGLRLDAAERAEAAGALPVDTLRQLYTGVAFSDEALANPLSRAEAESGPLSRALLYRTALVQTVPTAQAEAVARAFGLAREGGRYVATARAFASVLDRIAPSAELAWFAPDAVRAYLAIGRLEAAEAWLALADPEGGRGVEGLLPMARLAGAPAAAAWEPVRLDAWWRRIEGEDDARARAALVFSLFDAVGERLPENAWALLLADATRAPVAIPSPALWYQLDAAARAGRIGEAVLLALLALGDGGPAAADPLTLARTIRSLGAVGLEREGRALAVEAAAAAGL